MAVQKYVHLLDEQKLQSKVNKHERNEIILSLLQKKGIILYKYLIYYGVLHI